MKLENLIHTKQGIFFGHVLVLLFILLLTSATYAQQQRVKLTGTNITLRTAFNQIEKQTNLSIDYDTKVIDVSKPLKKLPKAGTLNEVMRQLLDGTGCTYVINSSHAIITHQVNGPSDNLPAMQKKQKYVSGIVTDKQGVPLIGVSVLEKGTTNGTITDSNGKYSLNNILSNSELRFSYVGFKTTEKRVDNNETLNIQLEDEAVYLNEVVAIGYGTVKKADLTGAVGSVQGIDIANRKTTKITQALQGAVAGVMVTRNNNAPGSDASIRIRGITTIGTSDPLIIVDGVPAAGLNDVNPNDVENISVLKDAASASIYGARAAAGVILVTTKHAKSGELNLNYNYEFGVEKPTCTPGIVNVSRYMQMINELRWNDSGNNSNEYPVYSKDVIDNYATLNAQNPDKYPNTDWMKLIVKDYAPRQTHSLSVTAGTKAIRTSASLVYTKSDGLYSGKGYENVALRFNNDVTINKMLTAQFNLNGMRTINHNDAIDPFSAYYNVRMYPQVYAATWADGGVAAGKSGDNVYGEYKYGGFSNGWYNKIGGKASIDFTPLEGLKLSAAVSPNFEFDKTKTFIKQVPYYSSDDPTLLVGYLTPNKTTSLTEGRNDNYNLTTQILANYSKSFGYHKMNAMAGYENYYAFYENEGASRDQYLLTSFPYLDLGPLTLRDNSGNASENAYRSFFGRLMYNYKNKYLLQSNVRYDGSSRFYKDYRWGVFPSFSGGWVVSEESFAKNIPALSYLKLRASWGSLGNERIGDYPYQASLSFLNAYFYQGGTVVSAQTAAQIQYAIQNISWEKTESYDWGVDANFFNNKLRFTGDYYKKTTKDMLLTLQIPEYIGFNNPNQNAGKMHTNGWEATVMFNDNIKDFDYSISFNISDFKSKMGDLKGTQFLGDQVKMKGSEFNEWYGYLSDGIYQTQTDVDNSAKLNSNVQPGDIKYKDISGPNGVPDGIINQYDKVFLGGSLPRYLLGGNIVMDYKGFDFSLAFQGVGKQNVRYSNSMVQPALYNWGNIPSIIDGKYWSKYNTDQQNSNAKYPRLSQVGNSNNYVMSNFWLFNGAYLRLKNVTLGYTLPKITNKVNIQSIRLFVSMSDFLSISKYPKGWDPENSDSGYPITMSYLMGLSIKF